MEGCFGGADCPFKGFFSSPAISADGKHIALYASIVVVCVASYLVFVLSSRGAKWLSPIALRVTTRVMGLLLAAIAMQFLLNALRELKLVSFGDA